ncbi:MAG TPA: DciA family protein [Stellaceae bacterium]|nr:DciA family protein [Stellaceae bacterium]
MEERRGGIRAIAAEVPRVAKAALGKRGFGEAQLVTQWDAVIGPELAGKLAPDRLSFARGERRDGVLRLRVASAFAVEAQHLEPLIIERINGFFGYQAVARLVLVQGPPVRRAEAPPRLRPLDPAEQRALDERVAAVPDQGLRAALARLGAAILGSRPPRP